MIDWILKFKIRTIILFLFLSATPLILISYFSIKSFYDSIKYQVLNDNLSTAKIASTLIEQEFKNAEKTLKATASDEIIHSAIKSNKNDILINALSRVSKNNSDFQFTAIYTPDGTLKSIYPTPTQKLEETVFFRDWYKGVSSKWQTYISNVYKAEISPFPYVVAIAVPIKTNENQIIGILVSAYKVEVIGKWLLSVNLGKEGFIFVVDRTGTLVTYPKIQAFRQIQNYSIYEPVAKVISGNEGIGEFSTFVSDKEDVEQKTPNFLLIPQLLFKGCGIGKWDDIIREKWLTAYTPVKNLGFTLEGSNPKNWGVIAIQPSTKAFEPVVKSAQKIIAFSIVLLLIGILFAFIFASIYNKNIKLNEQLTIANENLRAREKELEAQRQALEVQNFNLSILNSVALSMSQSLNLNKIFEQVLEETLKACNVDTGAILTIDVQTNELIISTEKGLSDYPKKSKIEESFAGLSLKSGQSMIINDAKTNDYFPDSIEGTIGLKALVCIPFKTISRPMGVLLVASKNLRNFSETEFKLLNSISNQIGIAAENARLYRVIEQHDREVTIANQNKSEMLKSISHQIRTPLNGIIGCAKVLLDKTYGELNDKQSKYIKNVLISGKILLQLSNDIIDLSRIESETFELYKDDFYFNEVINEIKDIMGQLISANGIILKIDVDNNIEKINADKIRVTQVMYNLLNNALRFTTRNGEIIIEAKQNNSGIEVSIIDSGTLINSEDFEKVFIEFQKPAKPNSRLYDGTGLGMSLSKKFVEMHGGKIWIEHTPDKKNKFIFTIPK